MSRFSPISEPESNYPEPESGFNDTKLYDESVTAEPEPEPNPEPGATSEVQIIMIVVAVFAGIIGFFIMVENVIVLITLTKGKPRQRRSVSYFIGNLAVADFVAGFHLVWFVCFDFFFIASKPTMYIIIMCSLWLVTIVVSVIGLFNFALFRLKLARSNESYRLSRRTAICSIVISWLIPVAVLVIPPISGWNCSHCKNSPSCIAQTCSQLLYPFTKNYVLMLAVLVLVAIFGLFATYLWMLHAVHQKVDKLKKKGNIRRKERQMVQSVLLIVSLFTVCILPVAVCLFVDYWTVENQSLRTVFPIVIVTSFINSVCNPFIYIWRLPSMKLALWRIMGRQGMVPENSSFKDIVLWKMSTKRQQRTGSGSPKSKFASESSDKLSRKYTSIVESTVNKL